MTVSAVNCLCVSAAVLYVGGRPVAETEYVRVYVVVLHPAGQAQDAHRRRPAAGQDSRNAKPALIGLGIKSQGGKKLLNQI